MKAVIASVLLVFMFSSCQPKVESANEGEVLLATVDNRNLYLSDISAFVKSGTTASDSIHILKGLVNNWIIEQLMIDEAEKNIPKDLKLNELVDNYRSSLLLYQYETQLVEEYLDTLVTEDQKRAYYNEFKDEYILSEPINKYMVAKFRVSAKKRDQFKKNWKSGNLELIQNYCAENSNFYELDTETWKAQSELLTVLPENLFPSTTKFRKGDYIKSDKVNEYYVKVVDFVGKNEIPPFDYIDSKITKVILNNRRQQLIKNKKQQLFDKEGHGSKVKVFVN